MPSSSIPAARSQYLLDLLAQVPDPRKKRGRRHSLAGLLAVGIAAVLGQLAADEKRNEIPAVRELLNAFADLAGAVITIDAPHTQDDTARAILNRQAGYVMTVKANMPTLYFAVSLG